MRFMILLKADKNTEAGVPPSTELIAAMMKYNEELTKAGVLLAGEGLQPSSKGTVDGAGDGGWSGTITVGGFNPRLRAETHAPAPSERSNFREGQRPALP